MDEYRVPVLFTLGTLTIAGVLIALTLYLRRLGARLDAWAARKSPLTKEGREVILGSIGEIALFSILPVSLLQAVDASATLYFQAFLAISAVAAPVLFFRIKAVRAQRAIFKKGRAGSSWNSTSDERT